jgi:hypothetical protein
MSAVDHSHCGVKMSEAENPLRVLLKASAGAVRYFFFCSVEIEK